MARSYYTYDDDDYLVEIFYDGSVVGSADKMINFERDENGNILSVSDSDPALGAGYHQYQYDAADRVVAASDLHAGVSTVIAYHPLFGPAAVDYSGAFVAGQSFGYDAGGRMIGLSDTQAGAFGYAHTPGGRVDEVSTPNGEVYDYIHDTDGSMRLTGISGPAFTFDISYNAAGDIAGRDLSCPSPCHGGAGGGSSETFAYDDLGRLTSRSVGGVEVENYLYDGSGNRLVANGETWSYSGRNELLARPGFSYGYDRNGNLTRIDEADGGYQTFGWSVDGRMISFAAYTSLGALETEATYKYDSSGRRLEKTVDGVTTKFFWEGSRMIAELDGANNPKRRYIYKGYTPIALVDYTGGGAVPYYYVTDHLGTPQKLVDQAGTIVWEAAYSAFGEVEYEAGTVTQPLRFPGQYYDSESGLYYNNQRYYDPATGRYISLDPIDGGTNLYAYPTNPLSGSDPFGMQERDWAAPDYLMHMIGREVDAIRREVGQFVREQGQAIFEALGGRELETAQYAALIANDPSQPEEIRNAAWKIYGHSLLNYAERFPIACADINVKSLHHFATIRGKHKYPGLFQRIADKFGLDIKNEWNWEYLTMNTGRHPNKYHEFVRVGMEKAAGEAAGNQGKFLELFEEYVKKPVRENPELLRKSGWK